MIIIDNPGYVPVEEMSLVVGPLPKSHPRYGELAAVIVSRYEDSQIILDFEIVADREAAHAWFAEASVLQNWIERS